MKHNIQSLLAMLSLGIFFINIAAAQDIESDYWPGRIYLKFNSEFLEPEVLSNPSENLLEKSSYSSVKSFLPALLPYEPLSLEAAFPKLHFGDLKTIYELSLREAGREQELIAELNKLPYIEYAERVPVYRTLYTPNDYALFNDAYHLDLINAEAAWDISQGSEEVVIAIVDDAVMIDHEDLGNNVWVNPGEIPANGIDDDGNGYPDDVNGYDVATNGNRPGNLSIILTHGTRVAGSAAAATDNGLGIASIGFNCKIMAVKSTNDPSAATSTIVTHPLEGIEYAISAGADVVNMSFGGQGQSMAYQELFDEGHARGIVFVAAAGNDGDERFSYPASYAHVISVGATDASDVRANFSTINDSVDIMAPGVSIRTTFPNADNGTYTRTDGTSFASPIVAGLIGLMKSINPCASPEELEAILKNTADDISSKNPGLNGLIGAGRINAAAALAAVAAPNAPVADFTFDNADNCQNTIRFNALEDAASLDCPLANSYEWEFSNGSEFSQSATGSQVDITFPSTGEYTIMLKARNASGIDELGRTVNINVNPNAFIDAGRDTVVCVGASFPLTASTTGEISSVSWAPILNLSDPQVLSPDFNALRAGGWYRLTIETSEGCTLTDSVRIDVFRNPFLSVNASNDLNVFRGDTIQLEASGAVYYEWIPGTGLSDSTISNPEFFGDTTTTYTLRGIGAGLCESEINVTISVNEPVSVGDVLGEGSVLGLPFPNPVEQEVHLHGNLMKANSLKLFLFDIHGRPVGKLIELDLNSGPFNITTKIPDITAAGLYYLGLKSTEGILYRKLWVK